VSRPVWEDLGVFFTPDTAGGFARPALITLQNGGTLTVNGHFDDPALGASLGEYDHDTNDPRFTCPSSAVADVTRGDTLTLDGKTYDILAAPMHDGTGVATLKLAKK
jgi:hypothetical protein